MEGYAVTRCQTTFSLDPYFERFYLVGFKQKWRFVNNFRVLGEGLPRPNQDMITYMITCFGTSHHKPKRISKVDIET
jgi:hypothetical protein